VQHDTTAACQHGQVKQVYIKRKYGYSNMLEKVICFTHFILEICFVLLF